VIDALHLDPSRGGAPASPEAPGGARPARDFAAVVSEFLAKTSQEVEAGEQEARRLAEGKGGVVEAVLALSKADLSLRFAVELRNRFLEAYREISRITV
jgi:flagellar hook-basal body complex protein FliE